MKNESIIYIKSWLTQKDADNYYKKIIRNLIWKQEPIFMFGKKHMSPRLVSWYGDAEAEYTYSGIVHQPNPWILELDEIRQRLTQEFNSDFNSVLANLYRDGHDYMGWHSDNESELGPSPCIASISLGSPRTFKLKHKTKNLQEEYLLEHGSLLIMQGDCQKYWKHCLPKRLKVTTPRINLTYRSIILK